MEYSCFERFLWKKFYLYFYIPFMHLKYILSRCVPYHWCRVVSMNIFPGNLTANEVSKSPHSRSFNTTYLHIHLGSRRHHQLASETLKCWINLLANKFLLGRLLINDHLSLKELSLKYSRACSWIWRQSCCKIMQNFMFSWISILISNCVDFFFLVFTYRPLFDQNGSGSISGNVRTFNFALRL